MSSSNGEASGVPLKVLVYLNRPGAEGCQYESRSSADRLSSRLFGKSRCDGAPMPSLAAGTPVMLCLGLSNTSDMTGGSYER